MRFLSIIGGVILEIVFCLSVMAWGLFLTIVLFLLMRPTVIEQTLFRVFDRLMM
jgi:hypothetical protein